MNPIGSPRVLAAAGAAALLLAIARSAPAQPTAYHPVKGVQVTDLWFETSPYRSQGAIEARYRLANLSKEQKRVRLRYPGSGYRYGSGREFVREIERTVVLDPGDRRVVSLFVPPVRVSGTGVDIASGSESRSISAPDNAINHYFRHGPEMMSLLVGPSLALHDVRAEIAKVTDPGHGGSSSAGQGVVGAVGAQVAPADWSGDWRAYEGFDGVILSADDYAELNDEARAALDQWLRFGGGLILLGGGVPARPAWVGASTQGAEVDRRLYRCGLGRVSVFPDGRIRQRAATWSQLVQEARARRNLPSESEALGIARVPQPRLPVWGLFCILFVFVIVIGPVNLVVLARMKRRLWMLWTVPLLSAVTCLLALGYFFIADGVRGRAYETSYTWIDQVDGQAASSTVFAFNCPLPPRSGLRFDERVSVHPLSEGAGNRRIRFEDGRQILHGGWLASRVVGAFHVRDAAPTKLRLDVVGFDDQGATVVNGFGVRLTELIVTGPDGTTYRGENLAPGAKRTLAAGAAKGGGTLERPPFDARADNRYPHYGYGRIQRNWSAREQRLPKVDRGEYVARAESNPFVTTPIKADTKMRSAVLHGRYAAP